MAVVDAVQPGRTRRTDGRPTAHAHSDGRSVGVIVADSHRAPRSQESGARSQEGIWVSDHGPEHFADLTILHAQFGVLLRCDVAAILAKIERGICLPIFPDAIRELTHEVRVVSTLRPSLAQVRANGPR